MKQRNYKYEGITILMPAYNEAENIRSAVACILKSLKGKVGKYEILIINDGSNDDTGKIAEQLAKRNKDIRVIHFPKNRGFGEVMRTGIREAKMSYMTQFHADNDTSSDSIVNMVELRHKADIVMSYTVNTEARSIPRRIISKAFVIFMNAFSGINIRYFNGCFVTKTDNLQQLDLKSGGLAIYTEIKVRLLKSGATYLQVPFIHTTRKFGRSKAVSVGSFTDTIKTIFYIFRLVYLEKPALKKTVVKI